MAIKGTGFHVQITAWNKATKAYQLADAANVTLKLILDGVEYAPTNSPADLSYGQIDLELTNAEANHDTIKVTGVSSTENVVIIPATISTYSASTWDGNGSEKYEITCRDENGSPLAGVTYVVTADEEGLVVSAGPKVTDAAGYVFFMLDPGTYWRHRSKSGRKFVPNPESFEVIDE